MSVAISEAELFTLLCSSVRYALGRQTYVVGQTVDIVRRHLFALTDPQRGIIARDIQRALDDAELGQGTVGAEIDHRSWVELRDWIREQERLIEVAS